MNNEIRPCTLWGQTFDAIGASVLPSGRDMGVYTKDNRVIRFEFATREALEIGYMEAITTIANALNAPVLATEEVLDAMKDAGGTYIAKSILVDAPDYSYNLHFDKQKKAFTFRGGMAFDVNEQDVPIYTVQADCPLGLQVLLPFNTEGELFDA